MRDHDRRRPAFAQDRQRFGAHAVLAAANRGRRRARPSEARRARRQRARQRHALLLAAGQHMRIGVRVVLSPTRDSAISASRRASSRDSAVRPKRDIVEDGEMRKQREILEHQADRALLGRQEDRRAGDLAVVEQDAAGRLRLDTGGNAQQRRLAGAGGPQQAKHFARLGGEG